MMLSGQSGTLTATVNGVQIRKSFTACDIPLNGPSTLCTTPATYTLSFGTATSWTVQPASAFSLTSQNSTSAVVKALNYNGASGTLTAIVGGASVTKSLQSCFLIPSISGPSSFCSSSSATFTVTNAPAGYTWSSSSNLALVSTSGNAASFLANANGSAWVAIQVADTEVARRNVTVGMQAGSIVGPFDLSCNCLMGVEGPGVYQFYAADVPSNLTATQFRWELTRASISIFLGLYAGKNPVIGFGGGDIYTLKMQWQGECGFSPYAVRTIYASGPPDNDDGRILALSAYPNPASSTLYIEPAGELQATLQSQQFQQSSLSSADVYRVQLVAIYGAVVLNQTISSFNGVLPLNVSTIPDGLYVLVLTRNNTVIHTENILIQH